MTHNITNIKQKLAHSQKLSPRPWEGEDTIEDSKSLKVADIMTTDDGEAIVATMNAADDMVELVETMLQWKHLIALDGQWPAEPMKDDHYGEINELTGRMHAILERFSL